MSHDDRTSTGTNGKRIGSDDISRRMAIAAGMGGLAGLAWVTGLDGAPQATTTAASPPPPTTGRTRTARLAHLTDVHVQPERDAEAGFAACLAHVQSLADRPELIITGGDNVMDVFEQREARTKRLSALWRDVLRRDCSLRVEPTIGNHDIWGWHTDSATSGSEPLFGKSYALDLLEIDRRYRSFDQGGWQVIILDSIQRRPNGYLCEIDPEQRSWLEETLRRKPKAKPTLIVSHAPILSLTPLCHGDPRKGDAMELKGNLVHADGSSLHALLRASNVRLCLSGHMHLLDRCTTEGVTYICDGAVSGNWWKGAHHDLPEGYGVVDLYDDGSFNHEYVTFGWKAKGA